MKQIKNILTVASAALILSSCSDWTKPESIRIENPTLETENPELYEAYLQSLRDYRNTDHSVVIAKFNNDAVVPAGSSDHINRLPDSVDFVILNHADELSESIVSEMSEIRADKGIKTLYSIDYAVIEAEWAAILEEEEAEKEENEENSGSEETVPSEEDGTVEEDNTSERFIEYIGERTDYFISLYKKYGYDGINVIYNGKSPVSLPEDEKAELALFQDAFFSRIKEWKGANADALLFFEGKAENIINHKDLLNDARYIILSAVSAVSFDEYALTLESAISSDIPSDKFILGVTTPSLSDPTDKDGIFSGVTNDSAIIAAGTWVAGQGASYNVQGISVEEAQNDYYNTTMIYQNIRGAISIMNPSPIK